MKFREFVRLCEEIAVGQPVKVKRSTGQLEDGWIVKGFNLAKNTVRVEKYGVGSKEVPEAQLVSWQSRTPQQDQERQSVAFNRQFWAGREQPGSGRDASFWIQKAKEWMAEKGIVNDQIVQQTPNSWFVQRAEEMMNLVKSYSGPLYRCISCQNPSNAAQEINWNKLGISWAFDENGAKCYHGGGGTPVVIQGKIQSPDSIDVETTMLYYLVPHYSHEKEIRLKSGSPVEVVKGDIWLDRKDPQTIQLNVVGKA